MGMDLEEFKEYAKNITRDDFINEEGVLSSFCPTYYDLDKNSDCKHFESKVKCKECYKEACKKIKFKDDLEVDNMSNEKTFREVIRDIKEGEVWECTSEDWDIKRVSLLNGSIFIEKHNEAQELTITELAKFTLQRKKVSFTEAFKSYEEGNEIESCVTSVRFKLINNEDVIWSDELLKYVPLRDGYGFILKEVRGEWYINE